MPVHADGTEVRDDPTFPLVTLPRCADIVEIRSRLPEAPSPSAGVLRLTQVIPLRRPADEAPDPGPDAA